MIKGNHKQVESIPKVITKILYIAQPYAHPPNHIILKYNNIPSADITHIYDTR